MPLDTGIAWDDNDGWLDLYFTIQGGANTLYHNQSDGTFLDQANCAGVTASAMSAAGNRCRLR